MAVSEDNGTQGWGGESIQKTGERREGAMLSANRILPSREKGPEKRGKKDTVEREFEKYGKIRTRQQATLLRGSSEEKKSGVMQLSKVDNNKISK